MLAELRVENLGIISELQLVLGDGLTAITGETGAGKTLLVEAVSLLLGGRADATLVRSGADEARVEGRFVHDDTEVVLARVVPMQGRSRAYVDGRLATVGELAAIGASLVDLHGQHDQQSLLVPAEQRRLLDDFAGAPARTARDALRAARGEIATVDEQLAALGGDERSRAREIDLLRFQIEEIETAAISGPDEDDELASEIDLLAAAEEYRRALGDAHRGAEQAGGDLVGNAIAALAGRPRFAALEQRLRAVQAELDDLAHELRVERDALVDDPNRLADLGRRRQVLRDLRRKYGETLAEVLAFAEETRERLGALEGHAEHVSALGARRAVLERRAIDAAAALSAARASAAPKLAAAVTAQFPDLALGRAECRIDVSPAELGDDGADTVTFLLAANPGEPARPLARAASGGELSRTMLAIRVVLSQAPPTLVFDEVDAGIGGDAGVAIGRALAGLGTRHQVLCVTHLAQVAAAADHQVCVRKDSVGARTVTSAVTLDPDARVREIARMLGGSADSEAAVAHARTVIEAGQVRSTTRRRSRAR